MMGQGGGLLRSTLCISLVFCLSLASIIVGTHAQTSCNSIPPSNQNVTVNDDSCSNVALQGSSYTYTLWYQRLSSNATNSTTLSVILSVPILNNEKRWYGLGFNKDLDSMIGTSAIIFWNVANAAPAVNTYYITAEAASAVTVDNTGSRVKYNVDPHVEVGSTSLTLAFEIANADDDTFTYQNMVVGGSGDVPAGDTITSSQSKHEGESSVRIDFQTNQVVAATSDKDSKAKTHGILNIIGWGVLLPHGAIVARYFKAFDPHWFYIHIAFQVIGFALVLAGLITGLNIENDFPGVDVDTHKALAIFVFVLACIQLTAAFIRPKKDAKLRRYWNWNHWWVGRVALVLAVINIFVGIHIAKASNKWKLGFGFSLAMEILLIIGLETRMWIKHFKAREPRLPQTAMQNRNGAAATAPPVYDNNNWDDNK